jgi:hypothetical protein
MWNVQFKSNKYSKEWNILDSHDNKTSACIKAYQVAGDYFKVKVMDADGSVLWSN